MAKKVKAEKPKRTGPMIVVLLVSRNVIGDVRVVSRNNKTTTKSWLAREFDSVEAAQEVIDKKLFPHGKYRAEVHEIARKEKRKKVVPERVHTEFGVIRRLPGQEIFFPPCPEPASLPSARSR